MKPRGGDKSERTNGGTEEHRTSREKELTRSSKPYEPKHLLPLFSVADDTGSKCFKRCNPQGNRRILSKGGNVSLERPKEHSSDIHTPRPYLLLFSTKARESLTQHNSAEGDPERECREERPEREIPTGQRVHPNQKSLEVT